MNAQVVQVAASAQSLSEMAQALPQLVAQCDRHGCLAAEYSTDIIGRINQGLTIFW